MTMPAALQTPPETTQAGPQAWPQAWSAAGLQLQRPLIAFDLETTGLSVQDDRIVEISCLKMFPDGQQQVWHQRCNPTIPMRAEATRVHGITDADVATQPSFQQIAPELLHFLENCDLTGFNIEQFDLPLLRHEFARVGITYPAAALHIIDSWRLYLRHEPRDLKAAYRFYCGGELQDAHSARADAQAAAAILLAQLQRYSTLPRQLPPLASICHPPNADHLDADGKICWLNNEAVLNFGRYRHQSLRHLVRTEPAYLEWITTANFTPEVVALVRAALQGNFPTRPAQTPADAPCLPPRSLADPPRPLATFVNATAPRATGGA